MSKNQDIPAGCPTLLRQLIQTAGSKGQAADAMGVHINTLSGLIHGRLTLSNRREVAAKAALRLLAMA